MPKLIINNKFAEYLKEIRTKANIPAKDMASSLQKSPAYITKLEKGEIKSLDYEIIIMFLNKVFDGKIEKINESLDYIYNTLNVSFNVSQEELEKKQAFENFDKVARKIPVSQELQDYIKQQLSEINYDVESLVYIINQNNDVKDIVLPDNAEKNKWYYNSNGNGCVLVELNCDDVNKILNDKHVSSNYLTIQAILYTINRIKGMSEYQSTSEALEKMKDFKFYSVAERHRYINEDELSSKDDIQNKRLINSIIDSLVAVSDANVTYANNQFKKISSNLKNDIGFTIAYMSVNLSSISELSFQQKQAFLSDIKKLIEKYSSSDTISNTIDFYET